MSSEEKTPLLPDEESDTGTEAADVKPDDESKGEKDDGVIYCCDPRGWPCAILVLVLICLLSFGSYYCYDNPVALQNIIINVMKVDFTRYNLLYSLYSWPNVILALVGGLLMDRVFGVRLGTVIFSALICLGQLIFALGAFFDRYWLMLAGRFVFGLGGESLAVAQNAYAVLWFKGRVLNLVFGLLLSVSRLGSTVNQNVNYPLYNALYHPSSKNSSSSPGDGSASALLGVVLFIGFVICILSLLCAVFLGLLDKWAERIIKRPAAAVGQKPSLRDLKDFPIPVWLVFLVCVTYYVSVFPFIGMAVLFLQQKYGLSTSQANFVNSIVYIVSAAASPVLGFMVDKTGFNLFWLIFGIFATLTAHVAFAFSSFEQFIPYLVMTLMGLAYSCLACSLWPMVSFIVPEHQLGTAYGIMQSVQNLGLAVVPIVAGIVVDSGGYMLTEVMFCALLCLALLCGIALYVYDATHGGKLNLSAWARAREAKKDEGVSRSRTSSFGSIRVPIKYTSPIPAASAFYLRNRFLSKMGEKIPEHVMVVNPLTTSYGVHAGILK
ncbi:hypothetical protein EMCRGX_G025241 [Ephydatia muelleri]